MSEDASSWCPPTPDADPVYPSGLDLYPPTASALCQMGWQPILIDGLLRDTLIRHFAEPLNIEQPDLRHLVWRETVRTSILIESVFRWRMDLIEKRPALIIKPNGQQNIRLLIGDQAATDGRGFQSYVTFWAGSHTVFCIHGSGASARILATEAQRELTQFGPLMVNYLGLHRFAVTEVGAPAILEESKQNFVVPITVGWTYQETWKLELESMKLRKVPLSVLLDGALIDITD